MKDFLNEKVFRALFSVVAVGARLLEPLFRLADKITDWQIRK